MVKWKIYLIRLVYQYKYYSNCNRYYLRLKNQDISTNSLEMTQIDTDQLFSYDLDHYFSQRFSKN